jgi:N-acetyl-1-D-myo-inositol-2-amino-2-deoxy-alpha-D-glucopyranoside deacetylase/mycothiol S-conjugate amidase
MVQGLKRFAALKRVNSVSEESLTLLAVHAHPDDESSGTGGILRLAAQRGHTTVLVTCTNGELGDVKDPSLSLNPAANVEDRVRLGAVRRAELAQASAVLEVTHLYMLGYHDSGMAGTETNAAPDAFVNAAADDVTGRLVGLIRQHRPQVVITYDDNGGYGHPDHIMSHRMTMAALDAAADSAHFPEAGPPWDVPKVYYTAWARSEMLRFFKALHFLGRETPLRDPNFDPNSLGCPDELITTKIDVRPVLRDKWRALFSQRSQMGHSLIFRLFIRVGGPWFSPYESLRCVRSPRPIQPLESDLFSGLD